MASTTTPATSEPGASADGIATRAELERRVSEAWIPFRLAVTSLGMGVLERPTSTGWTYRELIAHAAAWEDRTAERLATFRESAATTFPGIEDADEFNAEVVRRTRGRDARAVLGDLDAAHARLAAELARLDDPRIQANDRWVVAIVAGNTFGHYAEHHDELFAGVPTTTAALIERVHEGWRPFRRAVRQLGLLPLGRTTPAGWTYKALLSHVAHWMEAVPAELPERLAGRRSAPSDVDVENAREAAAAPSRSAGDIVERLDAAYAGVLRELERLPGDREIPFLAVRLVAGETYGHFAEHQPELDGSIARGGAAVVARFDEVWRPFRAAIRQRGRAGLASPTPAGWSYHDLAAHATGWMEQAVRELRSGEFASWTAETIQAFNDRSVRAHQLVGPEAMLDELDSAHRRLRSAVVALTDEELADPKRFGMVGAYTFLHWEHHFAELGIPT